MIKLRSTVGNHYKLLPRQESRDTTLETQTGRKTTLDTQQSRYITLETQ